MQENKIAEVFKALAHPSRVRILQILEEKGEKCVRELERLVKIKQSNLSQHLRILKDRGIIECERKGMKICYRLKNKKIMDVIKCATEKCSMRGR